MRLRFRLAPIAPKPAGGRSGHDHPKLPSGFPNSNLSSPGSRAPIQENPWAPAENPWDYLRPMSVGAEYQRVYVLRP